MPRFEDVASVMVVVLFVAFCAFVAVFGVRSARMEAGCLQAGYPSATMDWAFHRYCLKRVDQTDVVVPYEQVMGK